MKNIRFPNKLKAALIIIFFFFASACLHAQQFVYWTEYTPGAGNTKIASVKSDGTEYSAITLADNTYPQSLFIYSNKLFWNELLPAGAKINQTFWTPVNITQAVGALSGLRSIAIDNVNNKIYWTSSVFNDNKICRANVDGTAVEVLISFGSGSFNIRQIAIDVPGNKMYWADFTNGLICKANLDGSNISNLVTGGSGKGYTGAALDLVNGRLYWTEINTNLINSIKTDGTDFKAGITAGLDRPQYLTYNDGKIFWTEAGNTTQCIKSANIDANGNVTGVTTIYPAVNPGGIVVGSDPSALPVELTSFSASAVDNSVELKWSTATEINNYGFEIERRLAPSPLPKEGGATPLPLGKGLGDGLWEKVGFVQGAGNSNSPKQYSFVDACPYGKNPPAGNLQYRLKQINTDGSFEYYLEIAEVNFILTGAKNKQLPGEFALDQNYPNPFNPSTMISYQLPVTGLVKLKVYDLLGKEVASLVNEVKTAGNYEVKFDGSNLPSGVYVYQMQAGNFFESKKFVLMK